MRTKVNLSIEAAVISEARDLGLNMSRVAETAIAEAARLERNRRWREENRSALEGYAREIEREGPALALSQLLIRALMAQFDLHRLPAAFSSSTCRRT